LSQVKIQGGASGSDNYTILAPATSTGDKTLTLPTATATLASTDANTFTGVQTFPAGSVSAPSITTTGDTNTGVYFSAADEISFATGGSQRAKIGTADLTITNGNLVIGTSGKGIDFSATAGTGTSELLADYEEGTFTPVVKGTSTVGTVTYVLQIGRYTKIGNRVFFQISVAWNSGTGTGNLRVDGLPFTNASGTGFNPPPTIVTQNIVLTANHYATGDIAQGQSRVDIYSCPTGGGGIADVAYDAAGEIYCAGHYFVT
jgi:hypothetical protein